MKNIALIGMMGCGKSTCGRRLARRLGRELVDTDAWIVERAGKPIPRIFAEDGEKAFRDLETEACRALAGRTGLVIACGGGLVLRPENVSLLRAGGVTVFLDRPAGAIYDATSMRGRPLAQGGREAFVETFRRREPAYRAAADVTIRDFSTVETTVEEILRKLRERGDVL